MDHKNQEFGALDTKKRSHASFLTQCLVLTQRSFKNMFRDLGYYWLRMVVYVLLAVGLGTIFYDLGSSYGSIQVSCEAIGSEKWSIARNIDR